MNACMESIRRPYCSKQTLIQAMELYSPANDQEVEEERKTSVSTGGEDGDLEAKRKAVGINAVGLRVRRLGGENAPPPLRLRSLDRHF